VSYQGRRSAVRVTRDAFEALTADLVQQCVDTTGIVLEKAQLGWLDIHDVLLVGGATRMPMVRTAIEQSFGKAPIADLNPDECVALGAALAGVIRYRPNHPAFTKAAAEPPPPAIPSAQPPQQTPPAVPRRQASALAIGLADGGSFAVHAGPPTTPSPPLAVEPELGSHTARPVYALPGDVEIQDATTHPLGIIVLDRNRQERVVELIPEGTPLPHEFHGRFTYAYENMRAVRVEVTEGHGTYRDEVSVMARIELKGLPPRPKGTPIDVIYRYGVDQILSVQVIDVETGQSRETQIRFAGGLSDDGGGEGSPSLGAARMRNRQIRIDSARD
jgi:molecular chaperone DnaK